ncbi:MAG: class I SAM-dependent methyltransferase [Planctomycetaceae bacterium]|jgi:SAM-dependent methyltransferase|nr:class I SAM-dependent methyltransferase [Planctomycetaceae bacterium]
MEFVFSRIYRDHAWGGVSRSGPGSDLQHLETYLAILQACLRRPDVNRVVDIGCGDWAASSAIDWSGVEYLGIEVVPELVQQLTTTYGSRQVAFQCADALEAKDLAADLCVVKEVLQHWSNDSVHRFLSTLKNYKFALITNDQHCQVWGENETCCTLLEQADLNADIEDGAYRPLDICKPPFNVSAVTLATYPAAVGNIHFLKKVLLWDRDGAIQQCDASNS